MLWARARGCLVLSTASECELRGWTPPPPGMDVHILESTLVLSSNSMLPRHVGHHRPHGKIRHTSLTPSSRPTGPCCLPSCLCLTSNYLKPLLSAEFEWLWTLFPSLSSGWCLGEMVKAADRGIKRVSLSLLHFA